MFKSRLFVCLLADIVPQRANIGNARIAGMSDDLHLKGYEYNILLTAFYISYVVFGAYDAVACRVDCSDSLQRFQPTCAASTLAPASGFPSFPLALA